MQSMKPSRPIYKPGELLRRAEHIRSEQRRRLEHVWQFEDCCRGKEPVKIWTDNIFMKNVLVITNPSINAKLTCRMPTESFDDAFELHRIQLMYQDLIWPYTSGIQTWTRVPSICWPRKLIVTTFWLPTDYFTNNIVTGLNIGNCGYGLS